MHRADSFNAVARRNAVCQGLKRVFFNLLQAARSRRAGVHLGPAAAPYSAPEACPFEDTQAQWKELSVVVLFRREVSPCTPARLKETEYEA